MESISSDMGIIRHTLGIWMRQWPHLLGNQKQGVLVDGDIRKKFVVKTSYLKTWNASHGRVTWAEN